MAAVAYPAALPQPQRAGFNRTRDMGVVRTQFDSGHVRQRQRFRERPEAYSMNFLLDVEELEPWWAFIEENAFGDEGIVITGRTIRFTAPPASSPVGFRSYSVSVVAEVVL